MTAERVIRLDLEYDGTGFLGWQEQARGRTVQGELRRALHRFLQQDIQPIGSGRTDAGTHARGLVAHLRTRSQHEPAKFQRALNACCHPMSAFGGRWRWGMISTPASMLVASAIATASAPIAVR